MRAWLPRLGLVALDPKPDTGTDERFGGRGRGFPAERWPRDRDGRPAPLVARLRHHDERLDLGREGRVLFVFLATRWLNVDEDGHAVVLEPEELVDPFQAPHVDRPWTEAVVREWVLIDDGIDAGDADIYDEAAWLRWPQDKQFRYNEHFKFGGAPFWTGNGPIPELPAGARYLGQMPSDYVFPGAPPHPEDIGAPFHVMKWDPHQLRITGVEIHEPRRSEPMAPDYYASRPGGWCAPFANFAFDGIAFLFAVGTDPPSIILKITR